MGVSLIIRDYVAVYVHTNYTAATLYEFLFVHGAADSHADSCVIRTLHMGLVRKWKCNKTLYGKHLSQLSLFISPPKLKI
jgi:hypothetical protein